MERFGVLRYGGHGLQQARMVTYDELKRKSYLVARIAVKLLPESVKIGRAKMEGLRLEVGDESEYIPHHIEEEKNGVDNRD